MLKSLFLSILAITMLTAIPQTKVYAAASIGRIVHTYGPAWVQRGKVREKAEKGQIVLRNDTIVTGKRGRVKIIMGDGSKVYIGAKSRVSLRKYALRGTKLLNASINMLWGKARFLVSKLKSSGASFRVRTPTAVLGVRGTEFVVIVPPTPELLNNAFDNITLADIPPLPTRTVLTEGAVDVSVGNSTPTRLLPGHTALIDKGGKVKVRETHENDADFKADEDKAGDLGKDQGKERTLPKPPTIRDELTPKGEKNRKREHIQRQNKNNIRDHNNVSIEETNNAIQNLDNTTEIIIKPSFVAPDAANTPPAP